jgi:alpha-L-fucosidase
MKLTHTLVLMASLVVAWNVRGAGETGAERDARMGWWREARFGMFVHWGLYAIPGGEWEGKRIGSGGEWILNTAHIPLADYEKLREQFNPVKFDAKAWVRTAHEAGMRYLVVTSKHHDGFCLWPSKVAGDWSVAGTPFKRDILRELADACKADGTVRFCVYYSIMDWHHPDAQGANAPNYNPPRNDPNYKPNPNFGRYLEQYMKPQLKELIENYDPGVIWFDGEWVPEYTEAMGREVYDYCRSLNAKIIVNNRVGKSRKGMAGMSASADSPGDFGTPEQEIPSTGLPGVDWESCMTMNDTWGFKRDDTRWKGAQALVRNLVDVVSKEGNYLLNVGPTPEGEIPAESVKRLQQVGKWMDKNGAAIHGAKAGPFKRLSWGRATTGADGTLYLHVFVWPNGGDLVVPMENKVTSAKLLASGAEVQGANEGDGVHLKGLPATSPDPLVPVIATKVDGAVRPIALAGLKQRTDGGLTLLASDGDVHGSNARLEKKGQNPPNIGYWTNAKDTVTWDATLQQGGSFSVELEYSLAPNSAGSVIEIEFGKDKRIEVPLQAGKDFLDFRTAEVGRVELPAGEIRVMVRPLKKPGVAVMDLRKVELKPVR